MVREIKFRAWDEEENKMFYWDDLIYNDPEDVFSELWLMSAFASKAMTFQQFTGLQDKHGKEIYEGDVVEFNNNDYERTAGNLNDEIKVAEVEYSCGAWGLKEANGQLYDLYIVLVNDEEAEVIGNIYDNPELLEGDGND